VEEPIKTMLIRKMQPADIDRVIEIETQTFGGEWTKHGFLNELENQTCRYFVLLNDDVLVGYAGYWLILEEGHITTIAVDPSLQKKGYGEYLLQHLITDAIAHEARWMTLEVRVSNIAAIKLYEKYDFTSLGRRKNYYVNNREDALVMWTEAIDGKRFKEKFELLKQDLANKYNFLPLRA
jgi:[ribosomal protein S18]-alanine N-acetyltransferase